MKLGNLPLWLKGSCCQEGVESRQLDLEQDLVMGVPSVGVPSQRVRPRVLGKWRRQESVAGNGVEAAGGGMVAWYGTVAVVRRHLTSAQAVCECVRRTIGGV